MRSLLTRLPVLVALVAGAFLLSACDSSDTGTDAITIDDINTDTILNSEATNVILATYEDLEAEAQALDAAVQTFVADRTDANLQAAQDAWISTRTPWESSESFLFGPVAEDDLDPALDSWPVDENSIQSILDSNQDITVSFVNNLGTNSKGFHTIEFLLFGPNGGKTPADFTDRDIEYLTSATAVLANDTEALASAWRPGEGGFATEFADAQTQVAQNPKAALDVLAEGMEIIADEVGTGKIGTPLDDGTIARIESKYSENSFTDFINNIRSIRSIYTGDYAGNSGPGLDDVVGAVNPDLDARVKSEIETAIQSLEDIPLSFRASVEQNQLGPVQDAQQAILDIRNTVTSDIRPLINNL